MGIGCRAKESTHRACVERKKKGAEPRPLLQPRRRGAQNSTWPAPFSSTGVGQQRQGAAQGAASVLQEPEGSGSSFCRKQFLTLRASFKMSVWPSSGHGHFVFSEIHGSAGADGQPSKILYPGSRLCQSDDANEKGLQRRQGGPVKQTLAFRITCGLGSAGSRGKAHEPAASTENSAPRDRKNQLSASF
jgi:hypothetical protein